MYMPEFSPRAPRAGSKLASKSATLKKRNYKKQPFSVGSRREAVAFYYKNKSSFGGLGNVVKILDNTGAVVVEYKYDFKDRRDIIGVLRIF